MATTLTPTEAKQHTWKQLRHSEYGYTYTCCLCGESARSEDSSRTTPYQGSVVAHDTCLMDAGVYEDYRKAVAE